MLCHFKNAKRKRELFKFTIAAVQVGFVPSSGPPYTTLCPSLWAILKMLPPDFIYLRS